MSVDTVSGLVPFDFKITVTNNGEHDAVLDWNGAGGFSLPAGSTVPLEATMSIEGTFPVTITVTNSMGVITERSFVIVGYEPTTMDQTIRSVWLSMTGALASGDIDGALVYFQNGSKNKYRDIFQALSGDLPSIMGSFSSLQESELYSNYGEYAINRDIDGENRLFFIYFIRDGDGIWRIESM